MNAVLTQSDYDRQMPVYEQQTSGGNPVWKRWNALGARGIDAYYNSTSSSWLYPLYDVHGNVKATLTRSGATGYSTANWKSYDVWGGERASTRSGSMFGYGGNLGHPTDPENGLIYMRARLYAPWTGRFLSKDPAHDGWNWFVYCGNRPSSYIDRTGQFLGMVLIAAFEDNLQGIKGGTEVAAKPWAENIAKCIAARLSGKIPGFLLARGLDDLTYGLTNKGFFLKNANGTKGMQFHFEVIERKDQLPDPRTKIGNHSLRVF